MSKKIKAAPVIFDDPEAGSPPPPKVQRVSSVIGDVAASTPGALPFASPAQFAAMLQQLQVKHAATMLLGADPAASPLGADQSKEAAAPPPKLQLNERGELVDAEGNKVELSNQLATLKANQHKPLKTRKIKLEKKVPDIRQNPYYDESLGVGKVRRPRKTFHFVDPGTIAQKAEKIRSIMRARSMLKRRQAEAASGARPPDVLAQSSSAAFNPNLTPLGKREQFDDDLEEPPLVEWWDVKFLPSAATKPTSPVSPEATAPSSSSSYADIAADLSGIRPGLLGNLVEHPVPVEGPNKVVPLPPMPLLLTKAERKKIRTQGRVAREKVKQEQIRLGLIEAPKAKVKVSNLMRVLGTEATADPTAMEKFVRDEMEARRSAHDARNQERKLNPQQRSEKAVVKMQRESDTEPLVTLFGVGDLSSRQKLYKVEQNAQQLYLTGCAVATSEACLVLIEGGAKPTRKYAHLMLQRIKWDEDTLGEPTHP
eukprot:RCo006293